SAEAVPAMPTGLTEPGEPTGPHGGRFVSLCSASFEVVNDATAGKVSVFAVRKSPQPPRIESPSLHVQSNGAANGTDVALSPIAGVEDAWQGSDDSLKDA